MAKGLRSKVKKRWRSFKRAHIEEIKGKHDLAEISLKLQATAHNQGYRQPEPKNAFLYPNDPDAKFPQYQPPPLVDFRSQSVPMAGTQFVGSRREKQGKFKTEVTTVIVNEEDEKISFGQPKADEGDDLAAALGNLGVKSKKEKQKERKHQGMAEEKINQKLISKKKKIGKRARTEKNRSHFKKKK